MIDIEKLYNLVIDDDLTTKSIKENDFSSYDINKFKIDLLLYQDANKKYKEILKKADNVYYVHSIKKNPLK